MKDIELRRRLFGKNYKSISFTLGEELFGGVLSNFLRKNEALRVRKCDKCKCYVSREDAIKGEPEIKDIGIKGCYEKNIVYTPHYCHRCVPKKLRDKKNKTNF